MAKGLRANAGKMKRRMARCVARPGGAPAAPPGGPSPEAEQPSRGRLQRPVPMGPGPGSGCLVAWLLAWLATATCTFVPDRTFPVRRAARTRGGPPRGLPVTGGGDAWAWGGPDGTAPPGGTRRRGSGFSGPRDATAIGQNPTAGGSEAPRAVTTPTHTYSYCLTAPGLVGTTDRVPRLLRRSAPPS